MAAALRAYSDDPDVAGLSDFTPTRTLLKTYLDYVNCYEFSPGDPAILTPAQFGCAVLRCFPNLCDSYPDCRVQRTIDGHRVVGYYGLKGPGSLVVHALRGNPRFRRPKVPAAPNPPPADDRGDGR